MKTIGIIAVSLFWAASAVAEVPEPEGLVLLTVGGEVTESNAAAPDPTKLGFFRYLELEYSNAVAFDAAMLSALPQTTLETAPFGPATQGTYTGPALSEIMKMVGAEGKTALPMAMDGYQVEIPWETIVKYKPILATHRDGAPISIGQLGPAITVFPHVEDADLAAELEALSVFAVTFIGVE